MTLASLVKNYREANELSQAEFAKYSGISRGAVAKIETGERNDLRLSTVISIANFLNVSLDELVGRQDGQAETHKNY